MIKFQLLCIGNVFILETLLILDILLVIAVKSMCKVIQKYIKQDLSILFVGVLVMSSFIGIFSVGKAELSAEITSVSSSEKKYWERRR